MPEITAVFWIIKSLSTAMGESTSDYLVHALHPVPAVLLGFCGFVVAIPIQLSRRRYVAWSYWLAVVMVGVFGTMAADVLHVGFGVPYVASSALCAVALTVVFVGWYRVEGTLSIHLVDTSRREAFYWAAVVTTFALGTAVGDLTANSLGLGYPLSMALFAAIMVVPVVGYRYLALEPGALLLVRLRAHSTPGRLLRRLVGQTHRCRRAGLGQRIGGPGPDAGHRGPGGLAQRDPSRRPGDQPPDRQVSSSTSPHRWAVAASMVAPVRPARRCGADRCVGAG